MHRDSRGTAVGWLSPFQESPHSPPCPTISLVEFLPEASHETFSNGYEGVNDEEFKR